MCLYDKLFRHGVMCGNREGNTSNEIVRYKYVCNCDACISPFVQKEIFHSSSRPTTVLDFPSFYGLWY